MLISLRKHAKYFYVLFFVIILAFVFWVPGSLNNGQSVGNVATVGDRNITEMEFWTAYNNVERAYRDQTEKSLTDEEREQLKQDVLASLMEKIMLEQIAAEQGIFTTDKEVEAAIKKEPAFQTEGKFDPQRFDYILRQYRMDRNYFVSVRRAELTIEKLLGTIDLAVEPSEEEARLLASLEPEQAEAFRSQMLDAKREAVKRSLIEGLKEGYPIVYNLDAIKGR